jgi:dephospho-CoA kinase
MRIIGLTGGIASGKSSVATIMAGMGIPVIDADQLARDAVCPGTPALAALIDLCGPGIIDADGALDRAALGARVFNDPQLRRRVEEIVHPAIKTLAEQRLADLRSQGAPVVVYMAPLLIEARVTDRVDEIWVVYVDRETQLHRLMTRDRLSRQEAEARLAAQMPMEEKRLHGRIVIDNVGSPEELTARVRAVCRQELGVVTEGKEREKGKGKRES